MIRANIGGAARIAAAAIFDNKNLAWRAVLYGLNGACPAPTG